MSLPLLRFLTSVSLKHGWYYRWSKFYQKMFESKHVGKSTPTYLTFESVVKDVGEMAWRKDTWVMLWDAISHPHATWFRHLKQKPAGDCDDIALYAAVSIEKLRKYGRAPGLKEVGLLTVPWRVKGKRWKTGGHNVCAFQYRHEDGKMYWAHISNWHNGEIQYHNSDTEDRFEALECVVRDILHGNESLGWAFATPRLDLIRYGKGRDI